MDFTLPTILWVQRNCGHCRYDINEGVPMSKACPIQLSVMGAGVQGRPEVCGEREEHEVQELAGA